MKKTVEITETKTVEMEVPAFFKSNEHYYMDRGKGYYTSIFYAKGCEYLTTINTVPEIVAVKEGLVEITMEEFYSKLNEAFNILSIGSHKVEEDELNRFSMDREQIEAHR